MRKALIFGVSGQDGALLAKRLLTCGYEVHGASRDAEMNSFVNLRRLKIIEQVSAHSANPTDFRSVFQVVERVRPDEIYNLSGQSSVGLSFGQPIDTFESIVVATLNILETIRILRMETRFYNAASSECFGDTGEKGADETSTFQPRSPYAVAKAAAFWAVANYRDAYGLFAVSGILFNHESPFRPERFVTQKIIRGAARIAAGRSQQLRLGNLSISRDWGWAAEYVEAIHLMTIAPTPEDYVIATGVSASLEAFTAEAFATFGLDWREHVVLSDDLMRPSDIRTSVGRPDKVRHKLGWAARATMPDVVRMLAAAARADEDP
jgi:GDPmannose 4,6-dehydratase